MADKLMNITITDYNKWLKSLDTQLSESTSRNSMKLRKVFKPTMRKHVIFEQYAQPTKLMQTLIFLWSILNFLLSNQLPLTLYCFRVLNFSKKIAYCKINLPA